MLIYSSKDAILYSKLRWAEVNWFLDNNPIGLIY